MVGSHRSDKIDLTVALVQAIIPIHNHKQFRDSRVVKDAQGTDLSTRVEVELCA